MTSASGLLRITYTKSGIGYARRQKDTVRSLGLRHMGDIVVQPDTPAVRGMLRAVAHLVTVEPLAEAQVSTEPSGDDERSRIP